MPDGTKDKVQKRLLLANISEIYTLFKSENADVKIGFSSFALLRPIWCIPVGSAGKHNVCVCTYHQNVKLPCVCDVSNPECMLSHCASTLGIRSGHGCHACAAITKNSHK